MGDDTALSIETILFASVSLFVILPICDLHGFFFPNISFIFSLGFEFFIRSTPRIF